MKPFAESRMNSRKNPVLRCRSRRSPQHEFEGAMTYWIKFAREQRFLGNWPAVNQNKINRTAKIAKSYARVPLSNINVARKSSVRQIAFRGRDFRRHEF